jgi:hypothetical protein
MITRFMLGHLLCVFTSLFWQRTTAQVDTIGLKLNPLQTQYLQAGNSQFLTWSKNLATGNLSGLLLWERCVSFGDWRGHAGVMVTQQRISGDTNRKTFVYTVSDRQTFEPLYDYRKDAGSGIKAYNYSATGITGADSVTGNTKIGFHLAFSDIPFCFETDIETLSLLPLKRVGQQLAVNFYHPGGSVLPKYYPVKVMGQEMLTAVDHHGINCWIIRLGYDKENYDLSWISVDDHEFLKLESHSPTSVYYKIKLFTSSTIL